MQLTELRLNRAGRSLLADIQKTHRTIQWAARADGDRVLWAAPRTDVLIVQSPQPIRAADFGGVVVESHSRTRPTGLTGQVTLTLIAHPTRAQQNRGVRGRHSPLPMDEWEAWFRRKLSPAVDVGPVHVQDLGPRTGRRYGDRVVHRWVGFAATGTVTDPVALDHLAVAGVGRGKAYGCGLLLAVPA